MMRKSKAIFAAVLTAGLISLSSKGSPAILAEEDGGSEIPGRMQPYTVIEYISEDEYVILQGGEPEAGLYNENGLTAEEQQQRL